MEKKASKKVAGRKRSADDDIQPAEALCDWYRIKFAELLFQLLRDRRLDRQQKLDILKAVFRNVPPVLVELCDRADDQALATSDVAHCIAEITGQLSITLADVMRLAGAAMARATSIGTRHRSNKLSRGRRPAAA